MTFGPVIFILIAVLTGCVTGAERSGEDFERRWVRDTKNKSFHGNHNSMVFHPLVFDDLVIGGNNVNGIVAYSKILGSKKWTFEVEGGVSNPGIAVGNYVFFSTYGGRAISLNASTGKLFWSTDIDYPTTKPFVFENGRIYIHTQSDELISLEASTGEREWTYKRPGGHKIQVSATNAPILLGSLVISGFSDGSIVALEKYSGKERWARRLNFQSRFRDLTAMMVFDKEKILVGGYDDATYALDGIDGAVLWKQDIAVTSNFMALNEKNICASTIDDVIKCIDPEKGLTVKEIPTKSVATQLNLKDDKLFFSLSGGGIGVYSFDSNKTYYYPSYVGVSSLPVLDPKSPVVYFSSNAGNIYSIKYNF